jgi:hypothetical protein
MMTTSSRPRSDARTIRLAIAGCLAVLSTGCLVTSLQPAYDDRSIVFEDGLVGRWENADDRTTVVIERAEWRSYKLTYTDRSATFTLHGNLTTVGSSLYLDVTQPRGSDPGPYLVPVHGIYRISLIGDTLTAAPLDYNWFANALNAKTLGRLGVAMDDRRNVTISSPTEDLRTWLARAPEEAFTVAVTFHR